MSNGEENVLENWEEIDLDKGLANQLDKIKNNLKVGDIKKDTNQTMSFQNSIPLMMVMRPEDEYNSGNYAAKPAVKILRRPTQQNDSRGHDNRPKQPIKTLQQREQEYAEARLRILGSAKNPEDELEAALDKKLSTKSSDNTTTITNSNLTPIFNSPVIVRNNISSNCSLPLLSNSMIGGDVVVSAIRSQENVLRMPKGPDGTMGFQLRR